jgi:single-strand DNA-binding protein
MKSVNKVIMIGNLVGDPDVVQINSDTEVAKFTLAINEGYKKPDGEQVEITTYIDCEAWAGLAKVAKSYLHKGSKVYVEGNLRSDKWTDADTGKAKTKHKIRIQDLVMLDSRRDGESGSTSSYSKPSDSESVSEPDIKPAQDDELPF